MTTASLPEAPPGLLALAALLVDIPSVSGGEADLADAVEARLVPLEGLHVVRVGDNVVARTEYGADERVVLAGHLDTVPPAGNEAARLDGDVLSGVGSADMKGGLAVMLALAEAVGTGAGRRGAPGRTDPVRTDPVRTDPVRDVTFCFYAREEVARAESGLLELAGSRPDLLEGDAAVLLEPTGGVVEAGCQGVLRVWLRLGGRRAHAARPWTGVNAVHRLAPVLALIDAVPGRRPVIDGCEYRESLIAVGVRGGVAGNVVPDSAELRLSLRFAPDRDADSALAWLRELVEPLVDAERDSLEVEDAAPAAPPNLGHPRLASLVHATAAPPRAKLGYTDVATFAALGVPAANFGPGDPLLAHTPTEQVAARELEQAYCVLDSWLTDPAE